MVLWMFWYMRVLYCFVPFGKTVLLYCYAKSLESWILYMYGANGMRGQNGTMFIQEKVCKLRVCCCVDVISVIGQCGVTHQDQICRTCRRPHSKFHTKRNFPISVYFNISIHSRSAANCFDKLDRRIAEWCEIELFTSFTYFTPFWSSKGRYYSWQDAFFPNEIPGIK